MRQIWAWYNGTIAGGDGAPYCELVGQLLRPGSNWAQQPQHAFGAGGPINEVGSRPADALAAAVAGGNRPAEMFYLESRVNNLKLQAMSQKLPELDQRNPFKAMTTIGTLFAYLNHAKVKRAMCCASKRMHAIWTELDAAIADAVTRITLPPEIREQNGVVFSWAEMYKQWERLLVDFGGEYQDRMEEFYALGMADITAAFNSAPNPVQKQKYQRMRQKVERARVSGDFSNGKLRWTYLDDIQSRRGCGC